MRKYVFMAFMSFFLLGCVPTAQVEEQILTTVCNPMNLSYRFRPETPSRREAADPSVVFFQDTYFLFASKSGGYWYSSDLVDWHFVKSSSIPSEEYAPTAIPLGDTLYFLASSLTKSTIYKTANPLSGEWEVALDSLELPVWDPAFFLDDDQKLYLYWGCSDVDPIYGVEIDYNNNFKFLGVPSELIYSHPERHGWEVPGDYNSEHLLNPWIEGAWMNKHEGTYYLQYAGPGTKFKSYNDGVYVSTNPLGPFEVDAHNPFAYKPEGFANGAGHGSTFQDKYGNYWHVGTVTVSVKHRFERRLGFYPVFFDSQGIMHTHTRFGDYPLIVPDRKIEQASDLFPEWMLLSYKSSVAVSSAIDSFEAENMVDENIRTYWAAKSGGDEWAVVDLGSEEDVYAVQLNFAEHLTKIYDRQDGLYHRYTVEFSSDSTNWTLLADRSASQSDHSHSYFPLSQKVRCRYLKVKNLAVPDGHFAISGFRIFGKGNDDLPQSVKDIRAIRNLLDRRKVRLEWPKSESALGYNVRFGIEETKLYQNYLVYEDTSLIINSLATDRSYYFAVEAFNDSGVAPIDFQLRVE
ncbi:MAG: family 43 glycosylhydrolase [Cyclobacteriaceae bacterium]